MVVNTVLFLMQLAFSHFGVMGSAAEWQR